jgi:hypothetical protein
MTAPVIQFKRGLLANLPGLRVGEPGFTTDSYDLYVGLTSETGTNKFLGSHRYWTKNTGSTGSGVNLVEGTDNGSDYITLKSPDSLAGIVTYTLPGTQGEVSSVLTNDGSGNLTWSSGSADPIFTGIATFNTSFVDINSDVDISGITTVSNTTDNTLGDPDTGAFQIDGGLGVNKNVTVGGNLNVQGQSEFVGVVTFKGGTINLGDQDTDDINVAGEFISNLVPNTDDTYDIGVGDKRWRSANFSGISTFNNVTVGGASTSLLVNGNARIIGALTIGSTSITFSGVNNQVTGITTFTGLSDFNVGINVDGHTELDNLAVSGVSTFTGAVDVNGGANISGGETILSSATISDLTNNRIVIAGPSGSLEDSGNLTFDGSTLTVVGYADLDDVNVSSAATIATAVITNATITNTTFGSGTAITSVDTDLSTVSASDDTLASAKAIKTYVDAQITAQDLDFAGDSGTGAVDLDSQTFTIAGTEAEIVTSASGQTITIGLPDNVTVGAALTVTSKLDVNGDGHDIAGTIALDNVAVSGITTFTGAIDGNGGADISGGETTLSSATVSDLTSGRVVLAGTSGSLEDSENLTFGAGGLIVGAGGINVTGVSTFSTDLVVGGDVRINGNDIKSSTGATAITLSDNDVTIADDLTINGNLYVSGNTTQVNTAALTVEDRTIDLGIVNGSAPASNTTWDLGVLFNYYGGGAAKKSAVIWEHGDTRFKFASVLAADTNGSNADTPQLTVTTFAPIEIGALWVNDCAGQSQVISCTGSERFLENITVDAGTF